MRYMWYVKHHMLPCGLAATDLTLLLLFIFSILIVGS